MKRGLNAGWLPVVLLLTLGTLQGRAQEARVENAGVFAPTEGVVWAEERPFRQELCLNGRWQFQPAAVPREYRRGIGIPPELPLPQPAGWERTPVKVPSPWNVNAWGTGQKTGDPERPYDPGSVYFPSYPPSWKGVEMGWLRRTFRIPPGWEGRRLLLHFEAVAGECQVWVNGERAGGHFDSWLPFELDITPLVRRAGDNEVLVGVRAYSLFEKRSERYPHMRAPYPNGSETERLAGIWQDAFLLGVPPVGVRDVFVRPEVERDALALEVTLANETARPQRVRVSGEVRPWTSSVLPDSPEYAARRGKLGAAALPLPARELVVPPRGSAKLTLRQRVGSRLKQWSPASPRLYAAVVVLERDGRTVDTDCERFGWRQFRIRGRDLLLNGSKIQLTGDLLHPFGPFILSPRYTWAWYRAIKDFGGNCVRPHAQVHPRHFLKLADELGLVVLDETSLFGSSIALNFEEPAAWKRFEEHYDGLVLRDRNHPSVLGWSFGNELFAVFELNRVPKEDADRWYARLAELALRARKLDPTRDWISCDGDEDLRGTLPVWSKHFGHGLFLDRLPDLEKPLMVGESGGSYYARPAQLAVFNGERAFEEYRGRNEALAIDLYENITRMARPKLAYFSASETAWFGLEHLGFGYRDRRRLPGERDGIFFVRPFQEGRPGIQIERLPPYVATLNPGWDPVLPLYRPLPMFEAARAALARPDAEPLPWRRAGPPGRGPAGPGARFEAAAFIGNVQGELGRRIASLGVLVGADVPAPADGLTLVDGDSLAEGDLERARQALERLRAGGGLMVWMLGAGRSRPEVLDSLLPSQVRLTQRPTTLLTPDRTHPWTHRFTLPRLYFAEDGSNRFLQRYGLEGLLVDSGRIVLWAGKTDWSLFNNVPENRKCGAVVLYEQLAKPAGAALVEVRHGQGTLALCSLDYRVRSRSADRFWRELLANMGLKLQPVRGISQPAFEGDALIRSLSIGRFGAASLEEALATDHLGNLPIPPVAGLRRGKLEWKTVTSPSRDRFIFHELGQEGPEKAFAVYFSFWVHSPRALDDLLAGGPDTPRLGMLCYASDACRLLLNGREMAATHRTPADYRTLYTYEALPLKRGWNHFLVRVASDRLHGDRPGTLAVRLFSSSEAYLRELDSAVEGRPVAR